MNRHHIKVPSIALSTALAVVTIFSASAATAEEIKTPLGVERFADGSTLIVDSPRLPPGAVCRVLLIEPDGQVAWIFDEGLDFPHSADLQENGNMIISDTDNDRVIEVDSNFDIVWNSDMIAFSDGAVLDYPNDANILPGDTILITDRDNHRAFETDRAGNILWQFGETGVPGFDNTHLDGPHNADRLDNGNTIIADSNNDRIIEVSPSGEIVWTFGFRAGLNWPRDADRLDNGNTLITDSRNNRIIEVNAIGLVVWEYVLAGFQAWPYEADRLDNGNTLTGDLIHNRVIEVNPAGEIVWEYPCVDCFSLDLDAFYGSGALSLYYEIGAPESVTWANYLILTSPSVQVVPLWTISLPTIDPPATIPVSFPLPNLGWIGIYSGLYSGEGEEAVELVWVNTGV